MITQPFAMAAAVADGARAAVVMCFSSKVSICLQPCPAKLYTVGRVIASLGDIHTKEMVWSSSQDGIWLPKQCPCGNRQLHRVEA
jgi:hypothetical protein